jgi:RNA polymerase sigma-70 factor (ECF subfamily)
MGRVLDMSTNALDEPRLVELAKGGDRGAFDQLARVHFGRIYGLLFRLVGNHEDAEDMAQDCFVRAYKALRFFRGEGSFAGWLTRIALHLSRDHQRRKGRGVRIVGLEDIRQEPAAPVRGPLREATGRELVAGLTRAIDLLPHNLRAALVLRVIEGLEYDEVAKVTGMRPGTVRTQVMKARRMLVRSMEPWLERDAK